MTALSKEMLEYQRAIIELPRFVMSAVVVFATAASFFVKDLQEGDAGKVYLTAIYLSGMFMTLLTFVYGFRLSTSIVHVMKESPDNERAKADLNVILKSDYQVFSWVGFGCLILWLVAVVILAVM
ncbi:MAG: hypothetical protein U5L46_12650 [Agrobacterium sp.]|nr:hypothetical protein [Agrobacterium sp.]